MAKAALLPLTVSPQARRSYLALSAIARRSFIISRKHQSNNRGFNSNFFQGHTGEYNPDAPLRGPLANTSDIDQLDISPQSLKKHLDQYVIGQERAKRILSTHTYNHRIRVRELERQEELQRKQEEREQRRRKRSREVIHPVETEYHGQQVTQTYPAPPEHTQPDPIPVKQTESPPESEDHPTLEKSNLILLGPSGVGKTYMVKVLAKRLGIPFAISDSTRITTAGYVGEDAEHCVSRLLAAADYDVATAERGIIFLDEVDKLRRTTLHHGKDISGEGAQQALLKILEGTTLKITGQKDRGFNKGSGGVGSPPDPNGVTGTPPNKDGEIYHVRTDNILFVCAGAFIGLDRVVLERISKGGMGFGATLRVSNKEGHHETTMTGKEAEALFTKHRPYYTPSPPPPNPYVPQPKTPEQAYNILELVNEQDFRAYGMIPEIVGRLPVRTALHALDEDALVRILTEPRDSLVRQKQRQFALSGIELQLTSSAIREIGKAAVKMGTGARALRTLIERVLDDASFEAPGTETKYVLITQETAKFEGPPVYFQRGQQKEFNKRIKEEEERYDDEIKRAEEERNGRVVGNFQEYRQNESAGYGG